eukprot:1107821-Prorocentrum_minimum.AAC.1
MSGPSSTSAEVLLQMATLRSQGALVRSRLQLTAKEGDSTTAGRCSNITPPYMFMAGRHRLAPMRRKRVQLCA